MCLHLSSHVETNHLMYNHAIRKRIHETEAAHQVLWLKHRHDKDPPTEEVLSRFLNVTSVPYAG
jgi:hypothetical protein